MVFSRIDFGDKSPISQQSLTFCAHLVRLSYDFLHRESCVYTSPSGGGIL